MDNRLNVVRRKIRLLRTEMLAAQDLIRKQMKGDEDCTATALRVMAMRTDLLELIRTRNVMGGGERLLDIEDQLKSGCRTVAVRGRSIRR